MKRSPALACAAIAAAVITASGSATPPQSRIVFSADRAPSVSGEIYRLDANGHGEDLSRSPYRDSNPVVSPDGKRVAFTSDRIPGGGVYEVGIDGHGLRRVSPPSRFGFDSSTNLAWQPHGTRLAAVATASGLWILRPGRKPMRNRRVFGLAASQPWSPDGRLLLVDTYSHTVAALTPRGREAWAVHQGAAEWSTQGLLAITDKKGTVVDVYDESGHRVFRARVGARYGTPSWSPDGSRLAVLAWPKLREWTSTGELVLDRRVHEVLTNIAWDAPRRLVVVTGLHSRWLAPRSADGKLAIVTPKHGSYFALGAAPLHGGRTRAYGYVPGCWSDGRQWVPAAAPLQFAGHSIVYESRGYCDEPFANLYSVAPDGSGLQRITRVQAQQTQPAVSPDGSEIAYVWAEFTGLGCAGCSDGIHVVGADGRADRTLTDPENCTFDDSPTWSPDGSTILYTEADCGGEMGLYTVPAVGGKPHDLGIAGHNPAWGPTRIAYMGSEPSDRGLWTANPDGSDRVLVAKAGRLPAWSSDGRLAYLEGSVTVVAGSAQATLPFTKVTSLAWSADGTRFVVTARTANTGSFDVYTVKTDGTDPIRLTRNFGVLGAWRG